MATKLDDVILELPEKYVSNSCGFALDIGSSIAKIAYRSKLDYKDGKPLRSLGSFENGEPKGQLRLSLIRREKLDQAIDVIKENCDINSRDGVVSINTTGIGGNFFREQLQKEMDIRTKNSFESDCFMKAFCLLRNILSPSSFVLPLPDTSSVTGQNASAQPNDMEITGWPVLMVICGSAITIMQINEDGSHTFIDGIFKGGRTFLGLARMVSGKENFHEMIALAENGNVNRAGIMEEISMKSAAEDGTATNGCSNDDVDGHRFPYGKFASDKPKTEDAVRSFLYLIIMDIVNFLTLNAKRLDIYDVLFAGNLGNNHLVQEMITREMRIRNASLQPGEKKTNVQFIRNGGHLGSIGAYLLDSIKLSLPENKDSKTG